MRKALQRIGKHANTLRFAVFSWLHLRTLSASVIAINNGQVILVRVAYAADEWTLPGGGVHRSESFQAAALRELLEETGYAPCPGEKPKLLGVYLKRQGHWLDRVAVYIVDRVQKVQTPSWEIAEVGCFDPTDLPKDVGLSTLRRLAEWQGSTPLADQW